MLIKIFFICVILKYTSAQVSKKEYKLEYSFKANWYEANLFCRDHGMQLATINSQEENQHIKELIEANNGPMESDLILTNENFWISGTDLAKAGRLRWFSTGRVFSFSVMNYYTNPEDALIKRCVQYSYYSPWSREVCDTLNYFVCEPIM